MRQAKPGEQPYKLADDLGLFMLVHSNGSRYWRLKYRLQGSEKLMALGVYSEVTLALAREKAIEARRLIHDGDDPVIARREQRAAKAAVVAENFKAVAEEWIAARADAWSPTYREAVHSALAANL